MDHAGFGSGAAVACGVDVTAGLKPGLRVLRDGGVEPHPTECTNGLGFAR